MDYVCIPIIVIISYIVGEIYKIALKTDNAKKFIPIVVSIVGGCLGIAIYYTSPGSISARSVWDALLIGIVSGESATGTNQIIKQLFINNQGGEKYD